MNITEIANDIIVETEDSLVELQREQMLHGYNAEGDRIGVYKEPAYEKYKRTLNPLAEGWVDLRLTGAFHGAITAAIINEDLIIESTDPKSKKLEAKYGPIFGLNPEFAKRYADGQLRPGFKNKIESVTGLQFGPK